MGTKVVYRDAYWPSWCWQGDCGGGTARHCYHLDCQKIWFRKPLWNFCIGEELTSSHLISSPMSSVKYRKFALLFHFRHMQKWKKSAYAGKSVERFEETSELTSGYYNKACTNALWSEGSIIVLFVVEESFACGSGGIDTNDIQTSLLRSFIWGIREFKILRGQRTQIIPLSQSNSTKFRFEMLLKWWELCPMVKNRI